MTIIRRFSPTATFAVLEKGREGAIDNIGGPMLPAASDGPGSRSNVPEKGTGDENL